MNEAWHGTPGGYSNHRCRCDKCRMTWNDYCRESRRKIRDGHNGLVPGMTHGTTALYARGCRCSECRSDNSRQQRALRRLRAEHQRPPIGSPCECCKQIPVRLPLVLDHDHETGEFRGWICRKCNLAIGRLGDSTEGVNRAILYLDRTGQGKRPTGAISASGGGCQEV